MQPLWLPAAVAIQQLLTGACSSRTSEAFGMRCSSAATDSDALLMQLPGSDAGKPDVAGAAKDAVKKSPLGFMQVGDVAAAIPGGATDNRAFTRPKPGESKGLPEGPTAEPPSGLLPDLNLPGSNVKKSDLPDGPKFGGDVTPTVDAPDVPSPEEVLNPIDTPHDLFCQWLCFGLLETRYKQDL